MTLRPQPPAMIRPGFLQPTADDLRRRDQLEGLDQQIEDRQWQGLDGWPSAVLAAINAGPA